MSENTIKAIINAKKSGKSYAAIDFVASNPELPAILSKLVTSQYPVKHDNRGFREIDQIDQTTMKQASDVIASNIRDADVVMGLFPEMEMSAQILISSIISPKDMNNTEINFTVPTKLKISPIAGILINIIKEHFDKSYKIEPLLPKILREILFGSGSYPIAVIPENSVDDLINGSAVVSVESVKEFSSDDGSFKPLGILGDPQEKASQSFSLESLNKSAIKGINESSRFIKTTSIDNKTSLTLEHITVTDNFNGLKMPMLLERMRKERTEGVLGRNSSYSSYAYESFQSTKLNDEQLSNLFYKNKTKIQKNIVKVKTDAEIGRTTIGEPLILKLPSEAVIPVYTPGNEEKHIGYFVLLDAEGNPLSRNSTQYQEADLRSRMGNGTSNDMSSHLLRTASRNFQSDCKNITFRQASKVYADIIEADLLARLRNGIIGSAMSIGKNEEVYRIMLARSLMKQQTQLMYIPLELTTYFAFRFNDYGVGQSLIEGMKNLNSLRAMLLFSRTMAQIKNSIGRTKVNIKLDPQDPNPQKTIEIAMHEVAKTRQQGFPLGINNAGDLVDWVQKAGVEFGFEGHPGLPDVGLEFTEHSTNYTEPSAELSEELRKNSIMALGLSPETVDNGFSSEFATTVVANNLLLSKRVSQIQEAFVPQITDHCRKVALNNAYVLDTIKSAIEEHLSKIVEVKNTDPVIEAYKDNKELLVHLLSLEFLSNFEVSLAQPDTVALKNQMEAFEIHEQALDKAISYYISTDILPSALVGEKTGERVDEIKAIIKAYYMRQWLTQNHVLPELIELGNTDQDGKAMIDIAQLTKDHINAMSKSIVGLLQKTVIVGKAADQDIEKITGGDDLGESSVSSDSDSDDSSDTMKDDMGGFGGEDDPLAGDTSDDGMDEMPDLDNLG